MCSKPKAPKAPVMPSPAIFSNPLVDGNRGGLTSFMSNRAGRNQLVIRGPSGRQRGGSLSQARAPIRIGRNGGGESPLDVIDQNRPRTQLDPR